MTSCITYAFLKKNLKIDFIVNFPSKKCFFLHFRGQILKILKNRNNHVMDNSISIVLTNFGAIRFNNERSMWKYGEYGGRAMPRVGFTKLYPVTLYQTGHKQETDKNGQ